MNAWIKSTFTIDSLENQAFEGFTHGDKWNGWACPFFDRTTAENLLRESEANEYVWHYDGKRDAFIVRSTSDPEDYEPEVFSGVTAQIGEAEVTLYGIGANSWVWEEAVQTR